MAWSVQIVRALTKAAGVSQSMVSKFLDALRQARLVCNRHKM